MNNAVENLIRIVEKKAAAVEKSARLRIIQKPSTRSPHVLQFQSSWGRRKYREIDSFHNPTTTALKDPSIERKQEIVDGLIILNRRRLLGGVWWGEGEPLKIRYVLTGEPEFISWQDAAALAESARRKPGDKGTGPILIRHARTA